MKTPSKLKTVITKTLLFILVWLASMLVIGIIGACLAPDGDFPPLLSIAILFVPIALATWTIVPKKKNQNDKKAISVMNCNQPIVSNEVSKDTLQSVYCTGCGTKLTGNAHFCVNCGAQIFNAVSAEPAAPVSDVESSNRAQASFPAKTYRVTGTEHYQGNIINLALENDDYAKSKRELIDNLLIEERIWRYNFYPVKINLVPEPENPYDPNAIKVIVDGEQVGYIKKGSCKHLLKVIAEGRLGNIDCTIGGGPYKYIFEDCDNNGNEKYEMEQEELNFSVVLHIVEREA